MHPYRHAQTKPDQPALVLAEQDQVLTYGELEKASNRAAHLFRSLGLKRGDVISILLPNSLAFPIAYWGAQRAGLMIAPVSTHLKAAEAGYILRDAGARALVTSAALGETPLELFANREAMVPNLAILFTGPGVPEGAASWDALLAAMPETRIADEGSGFYMVYSSGSTGRPKGILQPFTPGEIDDLAPLEQRIAPPLPDEPPTISLIPAPLYHAAPLFGMISAIRRGDTAVILERFDALNTLRAIEKWRVASVQMVPTMFVRLLALSDEERAAFDLSSLKRIGHSAAPCPVSIKRRMIEWLGPIIYESYSGSEANGMTSITPEEWLQKPGSVGRASWGTVHICDEETGDELPPHVPGLVYFDGAQEFDYRNDPEKTAKSRHVRHRSWSTLGDIGYLDVDGYLFLCDRKDFTIISGGVNIYPQSVEDLLIGHPKVLDAAVIGVPNDQFGEEVKAVVQLKEPAEASRPLEAELIAYCRESISKISCPRSIDFVEDLPRLPTGKLAKFEVRKRYWPEGRAIAGDAPRGRQ